VPGFVCARRHSKEAFPNTHTPPHLNPDSSAPPASARGHVRTIKQPFVLLRETVGVCDAGSARRKQSLCVSPSRISHHTNVGSSLSCSDATQSTCRGQGITKCSNGEDRRFVRCRRGGCAVRPKGLKGDGYGHGSALTRRASADTTKRACVWTRVRVCCVCFCTRVCLLRTVFDQFCTPWDTV